MISGGPRRHRGNGRAILIHQPLGLGRRLARPLAPRRHIRELEPIGNDAPLRQQLRNRLQERRLHARAGPVRAQVAHRGVGRTGDEELGLHGFQGSSISAPQTITRDSGQCRFASRAPALRPSRGDTPRTPRLQGQEGGWSGGCPASRARGLAPLAKRRARCAAKFAEGWIPVTSPRMTRWAFLTRRCRRAAAAAPRARRWHPAAARRASGRRRRWARAR